MKKIFLNNRFVPVNRARVSVLDRGFLYGDGVFETMRVYSGKIFKKTPARARVFGGSTWRWRAMARC